ncbi:hypothetical protein GCM10027073_28110 [Streptomyces chlorus]
MVSPLFRTADPFLQQFLELVDRPDRLRGRIGAVVLCAAARVAGRVLDEHRGHRLQRPPDMGLSVGAGRWRAVNTPHLVALVRAGARFERGRLVERPEARAA